MLRFSIALLLFAGDLAAQAQSDRAIYNDGMRAFARKDYSKSAELLSAYLGRKGAGPENQTEARRTLGFSYFFLSRYADAKPLLEQSSAASPQDVDLAYSLGIACLRVQDVAGARSAFARMAGIDAASAPSRILLAKIMMREQMEDQAAAELAEALKSNPNAPGLHFLLGEIAIYKGDPDRAIKELETEIKLNPAQDAAFYRLGDAYSRKRMLPEAARALKTAIWLNPDFSSPYILLGKIYEQQADMTSAEAMLRKALSMDAGNSATHYLLGTILRKTGRNQEADAEIEAYKRLNDKRR